MTLINRWFKTHCEYYKAQRVIQCFQYHFLTFNGEYKYNDETCMRAKLGNYAS